MNTFALSFTDAFGVPHPAAVAMVASANMQGSLTVDTAGAETAGYSALTYQVRFWHSAAARAAGAQPQMLTIDNMMGVFTVTGDSANLPRSEWCEACRAHFETVVIPTLNPAV